MASFVQIVEFQTTRFDELRTIAEEMDPPASGDAPLLRRTITADRNRPGYYFTILEFDSYESAMKASASPEVSRLRLRMDELCDAPPTFYDLTVLDTWPSGVPQTARKLAAQAKAKKIATRAKTLAAGAATAAVGAVAAAKAARKQSDNASGQDAAVDTYSEQAAAPGTETVIVTEAVSTPGDEPGRIYTSSTEPPLDYPDDQRRPL